MTAFSATSERQIKEREAQAERDVKVEDAILSLIMRNPEGRRWMWLQLSFCRVYQGDSGVDFGTMAFEKGLRNYGLKLLTSLTRAVPDLYILMTKEQSGVKLAEDPTNDD